MGWPWHLQVLPPQFAAITSIDMDVGNTPVDPACVRACVCVRLCVRAPPDGDCVCLCDCACVRHPMVTACVRVFVRLCVRAPPDGDCVRVFVRLCVRAPPGGECVRTWERVACTCGVLSAHVLRVLDLACSLSAASGLLIM